MKVYTPDTFCAQLIIHHMRICMCFRWNSYINCFLPEINITFCGAGATSTSSNISSVQNMKRFLKLFSKISSRNKNAFSIITKKKKKKKKKKKNLKELIPRSLFLSISNISSISKFMQNMKRFLKLFSKMRSRNQNTSSRLKREITLKELNTRPLFLSNSNISSIATFI